MTSPVTVDMSVAATGRALQESPVTARVKIAKRTPGTILIVCILLFDWLNLRGTFEFVKVSQAQDQTRYTIGAEPFINHVLQPRIQYRINNGVANQPDQNHDELWLELHVFL